MRARGIQRSRYTPNRTSKRKFQQEESPSSQSPATQTMCMKDRWIAVEGDHPLCHIVHWAPKSTDWSSGWYSVLIRPIGHAGPAQSLHHTLHMVISCNISSLRHVDDTSPVLRPAIHMALGLGGELGRWECLRAKEKDSGSRRQEKAARFE